MEETRYPYRLQLSVKCHVVPAVPRKRHFNHRQLRMAELGNYLTCSRKRTETRGEGGRGREEGNPFTSLLSPF